MSTDTKKKSRSPRKPLSDADAFDQLLQIRINKELKTMLKDAAKKAGDNSSAGYVRRLLIRHFHEGEDS